MSFPEAIGAAIAVIALGIFGLALVLSALQWVVGLATMRTKAPHWMGISDYAGPLFLCAVGAVGVMAWLAFR